MKSWHIGLKRLALSLLFGLAAAAQTPAGYTAIGRFEAPSAQRVLGPRDAASQEILDKYQAAIADAARRDPARIDRNLIAITPDNKSLTWKGEGSDEKVLTVVFTGYTGYDALVGGPTTLARDVWVAMPEEFQNFCATHDIPESSLTLRLEQLIGLNPDGGRTRLVEIWASPGDIFRPSPDPEISDHEASLDFPVSGWLTVSPEHMKWIDDLKAISYLPTGFPWTRLGYTYDWGNPNSNIGLSEFVIRQGATVEIQSVNRPEDYCKPASSSAPAFAASNVVNLASGMGGSVSPGEFVSIGGRNLGSNVYFDGHPATVASASASEVHALVPDTVSGHYVTEVVVENQGVRSEPVVLPVVDARPGIFTANATGKGPAVAVNQDGTFNTNDRPAARGSIVSFWATGLGTALPGSASYPVPARPVRVDFDGAASIGDIQFAGMVYPGVAQINVTIPENTPQNGWADVYLTAGAETSSIGVRVRVK